MKLKVMIDDLTIFEDTAEKFNEARPVVFSKPENSNKLSELVPLDDHRSVTASTATHAVAVMPKTTLYDLWHREKISTDTLMKLFGVTPEDLTNSNT